MSSAGAAADGESRSPNSKSTVPGGELSQSGPRSAEIAARMDPAGVRELEAAGIIDSKFGTVTLLRLTGGADGARSCLGFIKRIDEPDLRISGWSCQGETLPARRAAISCMLNRLALLTRRKRPETGRIVRPRRTQARRLRDRGCAGPVGRLGDRAQTTRGCAAPSRFARMHSAKALVFMKLFSSLRHYCDPVWPN